MVMCSWSTSSILSRKLNAPVRSLVWKNLRLKLKKRINLVCWSILFDSHLFGATIHMTTQLRYHFSLLYKLEDTAPELELLRPFSYLSLIRWWCIDIICISSIICCHVLSDKIAVGKHSSFTANLKDGMNISFSSHGPQVSLTHIPWLSVALTKHEHIYWEKSEYLFVPQILVNPWFTFDIRVSQRTLESMSQHLMRPPQLEVRAQHLMLLRRARLRKARARRALHLSLHLL